jgi:hypothetical protein
MLNRGHSSGDVPPPPANSNGNGNGNHPALPPVPVPAEPLQRAMAEGLPQWDLEPPAVLLRRRAG